MGFGSDYWHAVDKQAAQNVELSAGYVGGSTHPAKDQLVELKSKVFAGVAHAELGFAGAGKGNRTQGGITPEMFGKEEREAMRQMAKVNEVGLTTHATIGAQGFAGLTEQGFREEAAEQTLHEVERAVDFAADVAGGGPVVVHTTEFPRPIFEAGKEFEGYPGEEKKAPIYLADRETGQILPLKRDTRVAVPDNNDWKNPTRNEDGTVKWKTETLNNLYQDFVGKNGKKNFADFYKGFMQKELDLNRGEEHRWRISAQQLDERRGSLEKMKRFVEEAPNKEYAKKLVADRMGGMAQMSPEQIMELEKNPVGFMDRQIDVLKKESDSLDLISRSYGARYHESGEQIKRIAPIEEVGLQKSAENLARAAIFAYDREKSQNLDKPLFIAPENIFPEGGYGSHPQELKNIIIKSREAMVDKLVKERHMGEEEAESIAKEHIKATFDIGHANTWKKFFKGSDEEFKDWLNDQTKELARDGIIGHVHLSDNFGYYDEHVTPGEGNAPIKEFVREMQSEGYKGPMIVEAGGQPAGYEWRAITGAWRALNSPIYRIDTTSMSWTDIEGSYFGRTGGPNYVVGDYAPSKDWTLWSETQLE